MEQTNTTGAVAQRPGFLTALCILTWVGCGISLVMNVMAYFAAKAMATLGTGLANMAGGDAGSQAASDIDKVMSNATIQLGGNVVGVLLCLVGSIMMWKLNKKGFYAYVLGQLLPIVAMFAFAIPGVSVGAAGYAMGMIFPVLFIVLYGLNLKHMK